MKTPSVAKGEISNHRFYKGALKVYYEAHPREKEINILELVLRYSEDGGGDADKKEKEKILLGRLLDEIYEYFLSTYGSHRKGLVNNEANKLSLNRAPSLR